MTTTAYLKSKKLILDSVKCSKGKPCGDKICIPKSSKCNIGNKQVLKTPGNKKNNNAGYATLGVGIGGTLGTATIAAGLGVLTAAKLIEIKNRYQANFATSAISAEIESRSMKVPKLEKDVNTVILAVGGFGTEDAYSESVVLKNNIESLGLKGLHVEPQSYAGFNVPTKPHDRASAGKSAQEARDLFIKTVVDTGYNPVAVTVAARLMAYQKANPGKEYQLMGHSGGGLIAQEAHEILHKAKINIKTTAIGSPDVGLIPGTGDLVTTTSRHDKILKLSNGRGVNGKAFNNVEGHAQNEYFADKDFRNFITQRLASSRKDRFDEAICKIGKNCGDICIPKKSTCKAEEKKSVFNQSPKTLSNNNLAAAAGMSLGAAIVGLPLAAYAVQKVRFQMGFSKSAELASLQAENYKVPEKVTTGFRSIDDQQTEKSSIKSGIKSIDTKKPAEQITFFAGGIGAVNGLEGDHVGQQISKMLPNHHIVSIETPEQDVSFEEGDTAVSPRYLKKVVKGLLIDNLKNGRSEVAVRIAARAYAYNQKHPNLPINLIGQSGGGMHVRESAEILKKMGVKDVKVVATGSPYFGLTSPTGITLVDPDNDPVDKMYGMTMPNKTIVEAQGHSLYFSQTPYKIKDEDGIWRQKVSENIWKESVPNKSVQKVLLNYFDRQKKENHPSDLFPLTSDLVKNKKKRIDAASSPSSNTLQQLQKQFSIILSRSYGKPIVKIGGIKISRDNTVTGIAQDNFGKIIKFTFKDDKLTYELSKNSVKMDSSELWQLMVTSYREDKAFIKKNCKKGLTCGDTCIQANDTCRLKLNQIANPSEISRLKQTVVKFKLEQNANVAPTPPPENTPLEEVPIKSKYIVNPETGIPYTIRELRKQASEKRIYGYGSMTIKELQGTLQLYDQKPESRDKITRGISKRTGFGTRAIAISGLSGRGTPLERTTKRNLKDTVDTWRKLEALAKFASSTPVKWGAAAVGAFLLGQTIKNYERAKQSYREGFAESARIAEERASKLNIQHPVERDGVATLLPSGKPRMSSRINQDNITFAVGSGKGYGAEDMKTILQQEKDPQNAKDYWFAHSNYVVPFNLKEFGTPAPNGGGEPGIASTVINGVGGIVQNFARKRNQDAVDLAAQIYAHAIAVSPTDGKTLVNRNKKINIVAHCNGGLVTKEALEIVSKMELKGSPTGKKVLEQVNAVYLGTPHFGFAENVSRRQRTIVSPQDPISVLPTFSEGARQQWISSVEGGSASDYLNDERVRDSIREAFGYYQGSPEEVKRRVKKRGDSVDDAYSLEKELIRLDFFKKCKTGTPCGEVCLPPGRKCRLRQSKLDPRKLSAKLGRGTVSQSIGGVGQDLERAYLRTSRLIKQAQRKSNKKQIPLTKTEKIKEVLAHEAKLVGVLLGQGTISKTLKSIDEKLIDFSDFASVAPEKISDAIAEVQASLSNLVKKTTKKT
ncbi:hypothetical protein LC605_24490 [Nostoc sp. CHAB 5836]|uniref:hypothetical protein n=1 Tax=Nostoc sp. CHAB 5836 TaxID=2780404 RepID=UPI001E4AC1DB|nr:hypothetical protein [Nostoc sp. CHAB 5836]MCC5618185.1 hypothetical protein [Nostoc sp. CHAB 5836]